MQDIKYGTRGHTDTYLLFKRMEEVGEYLQHSRSPLGRFKAADSVNYSQTSEEDQVSSNEVEYLTIETRVNYDFQRGDLLYAKAGKKTWRIISIIVNDDADSKECSARPRKITTLSLIRRLTDR